MAVQTYVGMSILHGAQEVACHAKSWQAPAVSVAAKDSTGLCDTWVKNLPGIRSFTWSAELMQDHAGLDAALWGSLGSAQTTTLLPAGNIAGSVAYLLSGMTLGYSPVKDQLGEIAMASVSGSGQGATARGLLMHDVNTARTSSGTGTAYQLGAVAAGQRMWAALHVAAASGTTPTLVVKLRSSATEGGTYTDRLTFSTASTTGAEWSSALGAITDTWWRITWTVTGTSPSFIFGVSAGIS